MGWEEDAALQHVQKRGSGKQVTPYFVQAARGLTLKVFLVTSIITAICLFRLRN